MLTDLRVGNCVVFIRQTVELGKIAAIEESTCKFLNIETGKIREVSYEEIRALRITKKWLRDNDFDLCLDNENNQDLYYTHRTLPISYSHANRVLYIYGRIYPTKVRYIHNLQNILLDSGIALETVFKRSHCTQIDTVSILSHLGNLRIIHNKENSNDIYGFSIPPKIKPVNLGPATLQEEYQFVVDKYKKSFNIDILKNSSHKHIIHLFTFFKHYIGPDSTGRFIKVQLIQSKDKFLGFFAGKDKKIVSETYSWDVILEFISLWYDIIKGTGFKLCLDLNRNVTSEDPRSLNEAALLYLLSELYLRRDEIERINFDLKKNEDSSNTIYYMETGEAFYNISNRFIDRVMYNNNLIGNRINLNQI